MTEFIETVTIRSATVEAEKPVVEAEPSEVIESVTEAVVNDELDASKVGFQPTSHYNTIDLTVVTAALSKVFNIRNLRTVSMGLFSLSIGVLLWHWAATI